MHDDSTCVNAAGVWLVYGHDPTAGEFFVDRIFSADTEVDALRYANHHRMTVEWLPYNTTWQEVVVR